MADNGAMARMDLNSDLGENFGQWTFGDDAAILDIVTSANVACGFHAGDPRNILKTVGDAAARNVSVGAHVGYRDLPGFGRRFIDVESADLTADVLYQLGALAGIARATGVPVTYVKPHGALYNTIVHHEQQAAAVVEAIRRFDPALPVLGLPGSVFLAQAEAAGLPTFIEAFADRGYNPDGTLVSRREPGALIHDPEAVADRVLRLATEHEMVAIDGTVLTIDAASVCVHGDNPAAVEIARSIRTRLEAAGVEVGAFVSPTA